MDTATLLGANMSLLRYCLLGVILLPSMLLAESYVLVVQGLAGEPYYQRQFDEQSAAILNASKTLASESEAVVLSGREATKEAVENWFNTISDQASNNDSLQVFLVGHGSHDQRDYKFNIPGPDLTGTELLALMENNQAGTKFILNSSSSSGALLKSFEDKGIIIATATKSGREKNATRFGKFFSMALSEESADLDKNKSITIAEAFAWAERETADFYKAEGLLATEHPQLQGTNVDRINLNRWQQRPASAANANLDALYKERDDIDREIERLRIRRIGMSKDDYLFDFQELMLGLADVQDKIDIELGIAE